MKKIIASLALGVLFAAGCTPKMTKPTPGAPIGAPSANNDFRKNAPPAGPAPKIQIAKAETFTLDNGLQVIVVPNRKLPRVSFQVFVDTDPIMEKEAAGYVEMMGGLLAKGTKTMSKSQIDAQVDFIGAGFNTSQNGISGNCLTKHAESLLGIMSDVLLNPAFPEDELKKMKVRQASALAQSKDDPSAITENVAAALNYGKNHPYGEVMNEKTLEKINIEQIKSYYSTWFKPNISYLVVVGDVQKAQVEQWSKKYFGNWKRAETPKLSYQEPLGPKQTEVSFVHKPGAVQSVVNITYPVSLKPGTNDAISASVMNTLLGGYFNSRINQNLREGHAYTYGARSSLVADEEIGYFSANASVRNEVTDSSVIEFLKELNRLRNEPVSADELAVVKSVMTGNFASSLEKPETVAKFALNTARYKLPADYYENYLTRLAAITPADVLNMAKKYLRPDQAYIMVVGEKAIADKLKSFSNDQKVHFYNIAGEPVVETEVKVPQGMTAQKVIANFIAAIGGEEKLLKVQDLTRTGLLKGAMELDLPTKLIQKGNRKMYFEINLNGNILMNQVTDGKKGKAGGMQGERTIEGEELAVLKEEAMIFPELEFHKDIYSLLLKGIENVDGVNAYAIEVINLTGRKQTYYYDMHTGLKIKEMRMEGSGEEAVLVVNELSDYKEVDGIMIAHKTIISGSFPTPVQSITEKALINTGVKDDLFEIK